MVNRKYKPIRYDRRAKTWIASVIEYDTKNNEIYEYKAFGKTKIKCLEDLNDMLQ